MRVLRTLLGAICIICLSCEAEQSEVQASGSETAPSAAGGARSAGFSLLPKKNVIPLNLGNFCAGVKNVKAISKQKFDEELAQLCTGDTPTAMFETLFAGAFSGVGQQRLTEIRTGEIRGTPNVQLLVGYAMRINKPAVPLLLAEEPYINVADYSQDGLTMKFKFVTPPINENDSDTSFRIEQFSSRRGSRVEFDDKSLHDLKLYRLYPNNFDFMMAVRSIVAPTEQFKKSIALRAFMTDPTDATRAYSVTILNITMNGRDQEDRVLDAVMDYVRSDMRSVYAYHNR